MKATGAKPRNKTMTKAGQSILQGARQACGLPLFQFPEFALIFGDLLVELPDSLEK